MKTDDFATRYTGMALVLVTQFGVKFGQKEVTGRKPVISEPVGPTSGGGQMSRQHINLVRQGMPTIGIGWVDCAAETCELRPWDYLKAQHEARHPGERLRLDKQKYADLFVELAHFFRSRDYQINIAVWSPAGAPEPSRSDPPSAKGGKSDPPAGSDPPKAASAAAPRAVDGAHPEEAPDKRRTIALALALLVTVLVAAGVILFLER
jgi:hypothetical protein